MNIRKKLMFTCTALVALSAMIAGVSLYFLSATKDKLVTLVTDAIPSVYYAEEIQSLALEYNGNCWKHIASPDAAEMAAIERANEVVKEKLMGAVKSYEAMVTEQEDRDRYEKIKPALDRYFQAWSGVLPTSREGKNVEAAGKFTSQADPVFRELRGLLTDLVAWNRQDGDRAGAEGKQRAESGQTLAALLALFALAGGAALAFWLVRNLTATMRRVTSGLMENAKQVAGAASQVATSSQSLAQNASEQAAGLEETSASTQEVTAQTHKNADLAAELTSTMAAAVPIVMRVQTSLNGIVESMGKLTTSSLKIASIVKVIDEIAFQTNILSLNAAVEAARSGDAGLGFAVVADEVRNLAHRSAKAAKESGALIEESVAMVRETSTKLDELLAANTENGQHAGRVKELVDHVSSATQEQAVGIREIANALPQLEQATQHVAASAEENASAAEEMTAQTEALKAIAEDLTITMGL